MIKKIILLISVFMLMFSLYQIVPYFYYNVKQETVENNIHKIAYSTPHTNPTTIKIKMKILLLGYKFQIQK